MQNYILDLESGIEAFLYEDWAANEKVVTPLPDNSITDGTRMDNAGAIQTQITKCALAYRLTGNSDYLDRAVAVMMNTASDEAFPHWNPEAHFLDTASIMNGMAYGYDWLYEHLTEEQKKTISEAIFTKGIEPALRQHTSPYCDFNWTANKTNWNFVCNSASIVASLAVAGEPDYAEISAELIQKSLVSMQGSINKFSIDGSWFEGTNYGQYAMSYFMPAMEAMNTSIGTDYGYGDIPRITAFNDFIIYTNGARETFNFGDGGEALCQSPTLSLYSKKTENPFYGAYRFNQLQKLDKASVAIWDIVWYNLEFSTYDISSATTDRLFAGIDTAVFHTSLFDKVCFAGLHGGDNSVTHSHLDSGSFVYDYGGVRFASELGQDNYNLPGYFTTDETKVNNRWNYYRTRAEGHNTLVINPDGKPDQLVNSVAKMIGYKSANDYGYAILNTIPAYADDADAAARGIYFNKTNASLLVQDEVVLKGESDIYWFMHFASGANGASVTVAEDGKSAILVREGKRVWVGIVFGDGVMTHERAVPLDDISPNPAGQATNGWYSKLQIKLEDVADTQTLAVYIAPLADGETSPSSLPQINSLSSWQ